MTSRDFAYWLQGLFELAQPIELNVTQTTLIKNHLAMVFKHEIDPSFGDKAHQEELTKIHVPSAAVTPIPPWMEKKNDITDVVVRC